MEGIKSGQGITDFLVVCDETNNTPDLIDANKFADIFIKPTKSINFIQLTFVAVRSGVEFSGGWKGIREINGDVYSINDFIKSFPKAQCSSNLFL